MKKGWYILNYHNISWEENAILRGVGGTFSPDIFNAHVEVLSRNFKVVGIEEGYEKFKNSKIDEPLLSFWLMTDFMGYENMRCPF